MRCISRSIVLMQKYPAAPARTAAARYSPNTGSVTPEPGMSFNSRTAAPNTAGMDMINEYFTANFLLRPQSRQAAMVIPDLEIPGNTAIP